MLLKPLTDALGLVQERIKSFEREFTNNESQTRLSLVDPVLTVLGWDPQDPSSVRVEYPVRQRNRNTRADYALLASNQKPIAFVEAKSYGTNLGLAQDQLFEYGTGESVPYAIATNGANWAVYKRERQGADLLFKQLLAVSIPDQTPTVVAIKLLSLWRELLTSQSSIDRIAPALNTLEAHPFKNGLQISDGAHAEPGSSQEGKARFQKIDSTPEADPTTSTFTLNNPPVELGRKPSELILPDGTRIPIKHWTSLLKEVVMWLFDSGCLNVELPWKGDHNFERNVLQETVFRNQEGSKYKQQVKIKNNLYLLTNWNARNCCNAASKLLVDCGFDNSKAQVTMVSQKK